LIVAGVFVAVLVGVPRAPHASGQAVGTATPTPTPTATPTVPVGSELLDKMLQADAATNSYHAVLTGKVSTSSKIKITEHGVIDSSLTPLRFHEVVTSKGSRKTKKGKTRKISTQLAEVAVGQRIALRNGKGKWTCATVTQLAAAAGITLPATAPQFKNATNLGQTTVTGIQVWHVRADVPLNLGSLSGLVSGAQTIATDFYIAQSDFTLVRDAVSAKLSIAGITWRETVTQDNSKYGEAVHVRLPAACKA
jgi:hypothetical protein